MGLAKAHVVLDRGHACYTARDFNGPVGNRLAFNEAAQLYGALECLDVDLQHLGLRVW